MKAVDKDNKKREEMQFVGQNTEEARAAVKLQRELKKKKDVLRKVEKKLKSLTDNSEESNNVKHEISSLNEEINKIEHDISTLTKPSSHADTSNVGTALLHEEQELRSAECSTKNKYVKGVKESSKNIDQEIKAKLIIPINIKSECNTVSIKETKVSSSSSPPPPPPPPPQSEQVTTECKEKLEIVKKREEWIELEEHEREEFSAEAAHEILANAVAREKNLCVGRQPICAFITCNSVHPRVAEVGLMMGKMFIVGGSARTLAMLHSFCELLESSTVLADKTMREVDCNAFEHLIDVNYAYLRAQREPTSGMRYVKKTLVLSFAFLHSNAGAEKQIYEHDNNSNHLSSSQNDLRAETGERTKLKGWNSKWESKEETAHDLSARHVALKLLSNMESELLMSIRSIVEDRSLPYVSNNDVILTFGRSNLVESILTSRARNTQRKPRRVIVLDAAPLFEGKSLAFRLAEVGLEVTYALITACCTLMPRCTKVFIGASSVLQNGDVFSRCGTAIVATCAKALRKPVLCFCESYKFAPAVWLGNLAQNTKLMHLNATTQTNNNALPSNFNSPAMSAYSSCTYRQQQLQLQPQQQGQGQEQQQQQQLQLQQQQPQRYNQVLRPQVEHNEYTQEEMQLEQQKQNSVEQRRGLWSPFRNNTPSLLSPVPTSHPSWSEWKKGDISAPAAKLNISTSPYTRKSPATVSTFPHSPHAINFANHSYNTEDVTETGLSLQHPTSPFIASEPHISSNLVFIEPAQPLCSSGYLYDLTPALAVDMVICEMGCLHTSAIIAAIGDRESRDAVPVLHLR